MSKQVPQSHIQWIEICGTFHEAGILEDPWFDPTTSENREMYKLTVDPELAPDQPEYIELEFHRGDCVSINGESGTLSKSLKKLNQIAGKHGIGRVDLVENRFIGMKSRVSMKLLAALFY